MLIRVSSPGSDLSEGDVARIEKDLEKIDRRLGDHKQVTAEVRVSGVGGSPGYHVVLEVDYGRTHLRAKADHGDLGQAVREARDDVLRQINDRSRGGHSSYAKQR
ncbi:MAG TPA: HPF/RaiA family ribosome-associated protein [Actinomycetota bacterium]|nr:HPF/RaiA family ribosome-associated protein [Actinomycetota bacterium]